VDARELVDYAGSLDCIHCGLCLQTCPTFRLTGAEQSSPRGRIHLMRAVAEGRLAPDADYAEELDFCLLCRHCESVCPAGVQFGAMMEHARGHVAEAVPRSLTARAARRIGFRWLLPHRLALRLAGGLTRLAQVTGLMRVAARLAGARGRALLDLPPVPPLSARRLLPATTPAAGPPHATAGPVWMLAGCVMPELFARVNRATARSLSRLGHDVHVPADLVCCGSLHAHNGDLPGARALARTMIASCEPRPDAPVVVNSAGCGAHMRAVHHLFAADDPWRARAERFVANVRDYSEVVAPLLEERGGARLPADAVPQPATWDDPCHLCHGQGVRAEPRRVLAALAGLELVPLEGSESCCGSAGIYSLLRPDDAAAVFAPKRAAFEASGARTLVTANPGCHLQWQGGLRRADAGARVVHLAELVDRALEAE
jgi:glycolate oxidase iron-sulfur subunit